MTSERLTAAKLSKQQHPEARPSAVPAAARKAAASSARRDADAWFVQQSFDILEDRFVDAVAELEAAEDALNPSIRFGSSPADSRSLGDPAPLLAILGRKRRPVAIHCAALRTLSAHLTAMTGQPLVGAADNVGVAGVAAAAAAAGAVAAGGLARRAGAGALVRSWVLGWTKHSVASLSGAAKKLIARRPIQCNKRSGQVEGR